MFYTVGLSLQCRSVLNSIIFKNGLVDPARTAHCNSIATCVFLLVAKVRKRRESTGICQVL